MTDFFSSLHQTVDPGALNLYLETGDMGTLSSIHQTNSADRDQMRLVRVALQYVGGAVRQLTLASFLETYSQRETALTEKAMQVMATFYVGGMLALMEQFLSGQLAISQVEFQMATLTLLRASRQGALQSNMLLLGDTKQAKATG